MGVGVAATNILMSRKYLKRSKYKIETEISNQGVVNLEQGKHFYDNISSVVKLQKNQKKVVLLIF